ncbi:MAG: ATP-dependent DNA helicase RecG, partial [Clostridia bacterium]|nr:ATP-dependent DNA helicase RecG [Clostridia bacterium]
MQLKFVKGLSDKRIEELNKIGINSADKLIRHFPRNYLDLTQIMPLKFAYPNEFIFTKAKLVSNPQTFLSARKLRCVKALCSQGDEVFTVLWFNQPYVVNKLEMGCEYLLYGRVQKKFGQITLLNPTFELAEKNDYLKGILPVYTLTPSLYQKSMQKVINDALSKIRPETVIPDRLVKKYDLMPLDYAYKKVHNPQNFDEKDLASDRIAMEEYFLLISAFKLIKGEKQQYRKNKYTCSAKELKDFTKKFAFEFTDGQKNAVNDIFKDLNSPFTMNRLLQGDVGCGKTAVALCALFVGLKSGFQGAMLAPTEVLAGQNYALCKKYFPDYKVAFLSGSLSVKERNLIRKELKDGNIDLVVGTHAIIQKEVEFNNLGICICDEQHRFGVSQRSALLSKGVAPDLLVMSATPIPRTLSLIFYGDLDITTIKDKPLKRVEVSTSLVPQNKYEDMLKFISNEIINGNKIYFVAPKIDGDLEGEVMTVTDLFEELSAKLPQHKIAILHGKMKDKEKTEIMTEFKSGSTDILVSTTVIEVGVDVPNATVMVITNADRFGLSQLHQLRGRVGRSDLKSYCFLLANNGSPESIERIRTLCKTTDGFKISEADFRMRGSGDNLGTRQSGRTSTELGALRYGSEAIFLAKKLSDEVFEAGAISDEIKKYAIEKYNSLCEISLN